MSDFSPIYEDNFGPSSEDLSPEHPESFKLPEYAKGYSGGEAGAIGVGRGLTKAGHGVLDLGYKLLGKDKERAALKKEDEENDKYWNQGIANQQSPNRYYAKGGEFAGEVLPSLAIPGGTAKTLLGRAGLNGLIGGGYEALTSSGDLTERGLKGALGFAGGAIGSAGIETVGKGAAGLAGKWGNKSAQQADKVAKDMGLKPGIGDLLPPDEGTLIRSGENFLTNLPYGHGAHNKNTEKLRKLIVPDGDTGVNKVTKSVLATDEKVRQHADAIYAPVKQKIGRTTILIDAPNMHMAASQLRKNYPKIFEDSYYKTSEIEKFNDFIDNPSALTYDEFRSIQQMLGSAQGRAKSLVNKGEIVGNAVGDAKQAYKSSKTDFDSWGQNSSPSTRSKYANIVKEHNDATARWEKEVLPWRKSDVAHNLRNVEELGAPKTASIIGNEADTQAIDRVRKYLKQYGPDGNSDLVDTLALMRRNAEDLSSVPDRTLHLSSIGATVADTMGLGLPSTVMRASKTPFGKGWYFGDSSHFMPSDFGGNAPSELLDQIMQGGTRTGIGIGRETADAQLSTLKFISDMKKKHLGNAEDSNISSANQAGTRGNNPIESGF